MRRFHQIFGWTIFFVFLLTGQYLRHYQNHLHGTPDGVRMLYRSRHIYILLAALLNIGLGIYFNYAAQRWRRRLQFVGSVVIVITTLLLIPAFFYEPSLGPTKTFFSYFGIIGIALGLLLHVLGGPEQPAMEANNARRELSVEATRSDQAPTS
jgi:cadmium resistance protein CadD (predicted permease)